MPTTLRIAEVAAALREVGGNRSLAAKQLGVTRTILVSFIDARESLKQVESEIRESWVDSAEDELRKYDAKSDFRRLHLILKTYGASRGYGLPPPTRPPEPLRIISDIPRPDYSQPDPEEDQFADQDGLDP